MKYLTLGLIILSPWILMAQDKADMQRIDEGTYVPLYGTSSIKIKIETLLFGYISCNQSTILSIC